MESFVGLFADQLALVLEAIALVLISYGGIEALVRLVRPGLRDLGGHGARRAAWLGLARWLVLALEFMLAADIVRTVIDPQWEALGKLAATALTRTFLNYFLERDLEAAAEPSGATPLRETP